MHLIKVNAINSTNSFARELFRDNPLLPATCISARNQLQGRGQRGTSWRAEPGRNLTFTVVFPRPKVSLSHKFLISAAVATRIARVLRGSNIPKLMLKWPNDIMAGNTKVGGILIENVITDGKISAVIIGIGLNVNQTDFGNLPNAGSLKTATGRGFDLDELLKLLMEGIEEELEQLTDGRATEIMDRYKENLFRMKLPSTFQFPDKTLVTGMITDVRLDGLLVVQTDPDEIREYDIKEIRLCF